MTLERRPGVVLDKRAAGPLYRQVRDRLRSQIVGGQLGAGARLPSTRVLAAQLGVSRTTTALAYELLLLEGYIESRVGDGSRVAGLPGQRPEAGRSTDDGHLPPAPWAPPRRLARRGQLLLDATSPGTAAAPPNAARDVFRICQPDVSRFPYGTWARLLARHVRRSLAGASSGQDAAGYLPLREAIAAHIGVTRGVRCRAEQLIITSGARAALDLVSRVLLDPGDAAWVEDPGYHGARGVLLAGGARPVAVPVDREGIDVEAGRAHCSDARLAAVAPSSQFPTAVTMSQGRRLALLEWARQARAWIVENDSCGEYRYGGWLESLQGLDRESRVIYIGSFSRVLFSSLRLGYLVAPATLVQGLLSARQYIDVHPPLLEQMALADFLAEGHFARHLRKMRAEYLERRDALVEALGRELPTSLEVGMPEAGMHLVAWLAPDVDGTAASLAAAERGLRIEPVSHFSMRPPARDGLVLGFAHDPPEELRAGVRELAVALRSLSAWAPRPGQPSAAPLPPPPWTRRGRPS